MAKVIASSDNVQVKEWVKLRESGRFRKEQGNVLVAGIKRVNELLQTHTPKLLVVTKRELVPASYTGEVILVSESVMKKATGLVEPEGIFATFPLPNVPFPENPKRVLALDGVSDPGNLGTLFRAALAFGWDGVFLLPGSCDPLSEKALRASLCSVFHIPFREGTWEDLSAFDQLEVYAAHMTGEPFEKIPKTKPILLVLGAEAGGLSPQIKEKFKKITIPMNGKTESINVAVAGGILMHYFGCHG